MSSNLDLENTSNNPAEHVISKSHYKGVMLSISPQMSVVSLLTFKTIYKPLYVEGNCKGNISLVIHPVRPPASSTLWKFLVVQMPYHESQINFFIVNVLVTITSFSGKASSISIFS